MSCSAESPHEFPAWRRSATDELVNAATHAFGFALAITGALVMTRSVVISGDALRVLACGVYLASLIAVYSMSTLSHCTKSRKWKSLFRQLDQGTIYLLIASTYTPFSIAYLSNRIWWVLLGAIWAVAIVGFASKVLFSHRVELVSVTPYVLLGWMPALAAPTLVQTMPMSILWWMFIGGVCYTLGTLFLIYDERIRHFHAVWHLWVIAGSACHFLAIHMVVTGHYG